MVKQIKLDLNLDRDKENIYKMIKNCLIHTQKSTQQAFQVAIFKAIESCPNFRYHPVEESVFSEKDL